MDLKGKVPLERPIRSGPRGEIHGTGYGTVASRVFNGIVDVSTPATDRTFSKETQSGG